MPSCRIACIKVPLPALQAARQREGFSRDEAVVVLEHDGPAAAVREFNSAAAAQGVRRGQRYRDVLGLSPDIRAAVVSSREGERFLEGVRAVLEHFSPVVEQWGSDPTVFWVHHTGMDRLFPHVAQWCDAMTAALLHRGIESHGVRAGDRREALVAALCVAMGHGDGCTARPGTMERAPVGWLPLPSGDLERLAELGITTLGRLREVSPGRLQRHCSPATMAIVSFFRTGIPEAASRSPRDGPVTVMMRPLEVLRSRGEVMEQCRGGIRRTVAAITGDGGWVAALSVELYSEDGVPCVVTLRPAVSTRDTSRLERMVELHLDQRRDLPRAVSAVKITAVRGADATVQEDLFAGIPGELHRRDASRIREAIELLEGACGTGSTAVFRDEPSWFPEQSYVLHPVKVSRMAAGHPGGSGEPPVVAASPGALVRVRRIVLPPRRRPHHATGETRGTVCISSGWWYGGTDERVYQYQLMEDGRLLWYYRHPGDPAGTILGWVE